MNYKKKDKEDEVDDNDGGIEKRRRRRGVSLVSLITFTIFLAIASLGTAKEREHHFRAPQLADLTVILIEIAI